MNRRLIELELKKQRLQFQSATLREHWARQAGGIEPVLQAVDGVGRGVAWLQRYPYVLIVAVMTLVVVRPKAVWRWTRRSFIAWQFWRRGLDWLSGHRPAGGAIRLPSTRI